MISHEITDLDIKQLINNDDNMLCFSDENIFGAYGRGENKSLSARITHNIVTNHTFCQFVVFDHHKEIFSTTNFMEAVARYNLIEGR